MTIGVVAVAIAAVAVDVVVAVVAVVVAVDAGVVVVAAADCECWLRMRSVTADWMMTSAVDAVIGELVAAAGESEFDWTTRMRRVSSQLPKSWYASSFAKNSDAFVVIALNCLSVLLVSRLRYRKWL